MFTLPLQLTSFVGREPQIGELLVRLRESRLLTLTGAGGAGKSRLAREVATRARDEHRDGVVLVPLAGVSDPELVPNVVASALGVREVAGRPITDTLVSGSSGSACCSYLTTASIFYPRVRHSPIGCFTAAPRFVCWPRAGVRWACQGRSAGRCPR